MAIVRWRPWRDLYRMQEEMDRLFSDWFERFSERREVTQGLWSPDVDISETVEAIFVSAEVPGIKKEDIHISVQDNILTIKGEKKQEKETKGENYHRVERCHGAFQRSFNLPAVVDSSKVKASYKDGVLKIELPKKEEAKPKEIPIAIE